MNTFRGNSQQRRAMETKAKPKPPVQSKTAEQRPVGGETQSDIHHIEISKHPSGGYEQTAHKADGTQDGPHTHATLQEAQAQQSQMMGEDAGIDDGDVDDYGAGAMEHALPGKK